jgi:stage II sporulation protein D
MKHVLAVTLLCFFCSGINAETHSRTTVRVGMWTLWHDKEVTISPLTGATLRTCQSCRAEPLKTIVVQMNSGLLTWTQNGRARTATALFLTGTYRLAAHGESVTLAFPLKVTPRAGKLLIVAEVPVERYVELVVAAESGQADGPESRRALAVVARSFALQPGHRHAEFDVCDSTHCQWVHWHTTPQAHAATLATAGESLWRNGTRVEAYFNQNCGGHTAAASEAWPARSAQEHEARNTLTSRPDPYCQRAGRSEWSAELSRLELAQALAAAGLARPGWKTLEVVQRGESGRATMLQIGSQQIAAEDFRLAIGRALGWNRIRSNWYEIATEGDVFLFHGRGSGHGVGLCQTGTATMAQEGRSYGEILAQYFPQTTLADSTTGAAWKSLSGPMQSGPGFALKTTEPSDAQYIPVLACALEEAKRRSGLEQGTTIAVRTYRSTSAFRDATLAPGWVAAFTEGNQIDLQPLRILAARKLLESVLLHEFLHALVEAQAAPRTPLWFREGLVEVWSGYTTRGPKPNLTLDKVNAELVHSSTEAESEAAHRSAGWYASQLIAHFGLPQVLEWLRSDLPQSALAFLR